MKIVFAKVHCEQSDYLIANAKMPSNGAMLCTMLCNRRVGAGADGVIFVQQGIAGYEAQQVNPNGELVTLCDCALRCVARFLSLKAVKASSFTINNSVAKIMTQSLIETTINNITFDPSHIKPLRIKQTMASTLCEIHGEGVRLSAVQCGIPYAVVACDNLTAKNINADGERFQNSRIFQNGINVAFIQIVNEACVKIRAYRSGCGEVPMCTNAAAAAVFVASSLQLCTKEVSAVFDKGAVKVGLCQNSAVITATAHYIGSFEM